MVGRARQGANPPLPLRRPQPCHDGRRVAPAEFATSVTVRPSYPRPRCRRPKPSTFTESGARAKGPGSVPFRRLLVNETTAEATACSAGNRVMPDRLPPQHGTAGSEEAFEIAWRDVQGGLGERI